MSVINMKRGLLPKTYRKITANAFWNRVTESKEVLLRQMSDDALANGDYTLSIRLRKIGNGEYVGLDDENLQAGFNDLKTAGIFTQAEFDVIFADGKTHEVPEALK